MISFLYQEEEYCLFLSEYELFTENKIEKQSLSAYKHIQSFPQLSYEYDAEDEYFKESEEEQEQIISLKIEDYRLFLEKRSGNLLTQEAIKYSGGVLIAKGLLEEYKEYEDMFSYETVLELIFKNGCLITTVDHSKAVLRIRKNLERGLRSMANARDRVCIQRFMNRTVICDYRQSRYAYGKKKLFRNIYRGMETVKRKVLKRQKE